MDYNTPGPHPHELAYTGLPVWAILAAGAIIILVGLALSLAAAAGRADQDAGR